MGATQCRCHPGGSHEPYASGRELDLIFVVSSYHHFKDPVALMRNARPPLKADGRLAIAEWLPWNEHDREGTTPEDMEAQMKAAGYKLMSTIGLDVSKPLNIYIFRAVEE
jgi:SAM-dependent methyltransferase